MSEGPVFQPGGIWGEVAGITFEGDHFIINDPKYQERILSTEVIEISSQKYEARRKRNTHFREKLAEVYDIFVKLGNTSQDECARAAMETDIENMIEEFKRVAK